MSNNNKPLPSVEDRNALELFEVITRFIGWLEIFGDDVLTQAIAWLERERRHYGDNKGAQYVIDAAITAMTWQVNSDLNGAPLDPNEVRRTPQSELEIVRVSLARIAQKLGVDNKLLPVTSGAFVDNYGELVALARTQPRGWNALAARIIGEIEKREGDAAEYVATLKRCGVI